MLSLVKAFTWVPGIIMLADNPGYEVGWTQRGYSHEDPESKEGEYLIFILTS